VKVSTATMALALSLISSSIASALDWKAPTNVPNSYVGKAGGWPVPTVSLTPADASTTSKAALMSAYRVYAVLKSCNVTRQGYLVTYVNDIELGRAREKITLIEAPYLVENKNLNTDALYAEAAKSVMGFIIDRQICQFSLTQLLSDWRTPGGNEMMKKDF
jgi:hypothetical protein